MYHQRVLGPWTPCSLWDLGTPFLPLCLSSSLRKCRQENWRGRGEGTTAIFALMGRASGKGRAPRERALSGFYNAPCRRRDGGGQLGRGPHIWAHWLPSALPPRQPTPAHHSWPPESSAFRSPSLSIHLRESEEVYFISKVKQGTYNPPPALSLPPLQTVSPNAQQEECRGRRDQGKMVPELATHTQPECGFLIRIPSAAFSPHPFKTIGSSSRSLAPLPPLVRPAGCGEELGYSSVSRGPWPHARARPGREDGPNQRGREGRAKTKSWHLRGPFPRGRSTYILLPNLETSVPQVTSNGKNRSLEIWRQKSKIWDGVRRRGHPAEQMFFKIYYFC